MNCYSFAIFIVAALIQVACSNTSSSRLTNSAMSLACDMDEVVPVPFARMNITNGTLEERSFAQWLRVAVPSMRADISNSNYSPHLRAQILYRGPTKTDILLGSGELRRQFGFRLRAANTCNVVYVMWHIEPSNTVEVSVKSNPQLKTHSECRDHGYSKVVPERQDENIPSLSDMKLHVMDVRLNDELLLVMIDEKLAWLGVLPHEAFEFDGPLGVRSDNVILDFKLLSSIALCKSSI
jgi:hypothetical protein